MTIRTIAETTSTNADMLAAAALGAHEGDWLRADRQSGGRGRLDRTWASPAGNLYASTIVRLRRGEPPAPTLALVTAVAAQEAATAYLPDDAPPVRIKWPNDLMIAGAKLSGMLLERSGDAVVIGIGINLASAPVIAGRSVTCLADHGAAPADPQHVVVELAAAFARWLAIWRGRGLGAVTRRWSEVAHPIGTALAATTSGGRLDGLYAGLDADGGMRLAMPDGTTATIHAGDVSLI